MFVSITDNGSGFQIDLKDFLLKTFNHSFAIIIRQEIATNMYTKSKLVETDL